MPTQLRFREHRQLRRGQLLFQAPSRHISQRIYGLVLDLEQNIPTPVPLLLLHVLVWRLPQAALMLLLPLKHHRLSLPINGLGLGLILNILTLQHCLLAAEIILNGFHHINEGIWN